MHACMHTAANGTGPVQNTIINTIIILLLILCRLIQMQSHACALLKYNYVLERVLANSVMDYCPSDLGCHEFQSAWVDQL